MKAVGYIRVSTERQVEGMGLDVQERAVRDYAKEAGFKVVKVYRDEGISGTKPLAERPGLAEAVKRIRFNGAKILLIYSLDRLARKLEEQEAILATIWKAEGSVHSADQGEILEDDPDDPTRTAIRKMRGIFSELERGLIAQRMRRGKKAKGEKGGYTGGKPPYGMRAENGSLIPHPEEQKCLTLARKLRRQGASLREIARALDAKGCQPRKAQQWSAQAVANILKH